jgi:hypothetical protein
VIDVSLGHSYVGWIVLRGEKNRSRQFDLSRQLGKVFIVFLRVCTYDQSCVPASLQQHRGLYFSCYVSSAERLEMRLVQVFCPVQEIKEPSI